MANSTPGFVLWIKQGGSQSRRNEGTTWNYCIFLLSLSPALEHQKAALQNPRNLKMFAVCCVNLPNLCILPSLSSHQDWKLLFVNKAERLGEPGKWSVGKQQEIILHFPARNQWAQQHHCYLLNSWAVCNGQHPPPCALTAPKCCSLKAGKTLELGRLRTGLLLKLVFHCSRETRKINFSRRIFLKQHLIACKWGLGGEGASFNYKAAAWQGKNTMSITFFDKSIKK